MAKTGFLERENLDKLSANNVATSLGSEISGLWWTAGSSDWSFGKISNDCNGLTRVMIRFSRRVERFEFGVLISSAPKGYRLKIFPET